jgi:hypothetical protein
MLQSQRPLNQAFCIIFESRKLKKKTPENVAGFYANKKEERPARRWHVTIYDGGGT